MTPLDLNADRLLPADPARRTVARKLYGGIASLPVIGMSRWLDADAFAADRPIANACELIVAHDPALLRLLHSQGIDLKQLGAPGPDDPSFAIPRKAWRLFAHHVAAFRGGAQALWLDQVFAEVFGMEIRLEASTADLYYDAITEALSKPAFRPRALFNRLNLEQVGVPVLPTDSLNAFAILAETGFGNRIVPVYEPDAVIDVEDERFDGAMAAFALATGEDVYSWRGYLKAHRTRRAQFAAMGATTTLHRHPTAATADLARSHADHLFRTIVSGRATGQEPELFRAQMLTEMARMSVEDGLTMTLQTGLYRNHDRDLFRDHGRDRGADIPRAAEYVTALRPLLNLFGSDPRLNLVIQASDEAALVRELAPLAGHYPALRLAPGGPFSDGPDALARFRALSLESAGLNKLAGFSHDSATFISLAALHDIARRADCTWLSGLVAEHRLSEADAERAAADLAYGLSKPAHTDGSSQKLLPQSA